jgi:Fe2+ transport system protein FeoA
LKLLKGMVVMSSEISLYKAKKDNIYNVVTVPDIELLKSLGIRQDTRVQVMCQYPLGGPTLVRIEDSSTVAVGKDIATLVTVVPETGNAQNDGEDAA